MDYATEHREDLARDVDCYWEAPLPDGVNGLTYPSLPEPYINLFIPLNPGKGTVSKLKSISDSADLFPMDSRLFGIRMHVRGLYRTGWGAPATLKGMVSCSAIEGYPGRLDAAIRAADGFERRVFLFREWLASRPPVEPDSKADRVAGAHEFLLANFDDPSVIRSWSEQTGFSVRTITRWFTGEIGLSPKKLARVARFHRALSGLHTATTSRYYLDAGYYDQAHFIKEFREFTGMTPEGYLDMVSTLAG